MTKREKGADRRERLEAERRTQKAAQRKRNILTAGIGVLAGAVIIGGTVFAIVSQEKDKPENKDYSAFGVSAAAADCSPVQKNAVSGSGDHVGPGTNKAAVTQVAYSTVPPTSGQHFAVWLDVDRHFYSVADKPKIEQAVHNLEHGYNVVWYSPTLPAAQVSTLEDLSEKIGGTSSTRKFIVLPWDTAYGAFPSGKTVAISHWGKKEGFRQLCGSVSGEALGQFVEDHPSSDSPEPNTP